MNNTVYQFTYFIHGGSFEAKGAENIKWVFNSSSRTSDWVISPALFHKYFFAEVFDLLLLPQ